ncbi:MAG: tetratricopeptide repeat protein [Candidatus Electrothrix sp. Rat3]|nr:tetratricopeptide repeat protein [Candidatus Electrothrix rattekaaiensis]
MMPDTIIQKVQGDKNIFAGKGDIHVYSDPPPPPPRQLPYLDACFLGRDTELAELVKQLQPGKVTAVCGPGGMGKSALAAQAVSRLEESRFPDGIIFHSFYGKPETEQALKSVCDAFQVEAKAGLAGTVRQALAGKKALLILDGAEEADDLKAVLALRSSCGVLITSRKRDDAQGFRLDLTPLDRKPAVEVLREHSGLAGDDDAMQGICKILDGWPVGLRIAGRYLCTRGESATDYLRWLKKRPFRKLRTGEHQEDNAALLLERSVKQVSADAVQALRLTGVLAFAPISLDPVMAVLHEENEDTDELELHSNEALGELVQYGLLKKQEERWQVSHALIHTYVRTELALSKKALQRVARYYIWFCEELSKAGLQGYARLDGERAHCLRLIAACLDSGLWQEVQGLVEAISIYLDRQGWWAERLIAYQMRLTAARQAEDHWDEGTCLNNLGYTCKQRGECEQALHWYEQCLSIRRDLKDRQGQGVILNNIAEIYRQQGKHELALQTYQQSLSIAQEVGDQQGEGATLNNIAHFYMKQGEWETALPYLEQCLLTWQELGYHIRIGQALTNIAAIYDAQGKFNKAVEYYHQALAIAQKVGDKAQEAVTSGNLGLTYVSLGDLVKAEKYITLAIQITDAIGHPSLGIWRKSLDLVQAKRQGA